MQRRVVLAAGGVVLTACVGLFWWSTSARLQRAKRQTTIVSMRAIDDVIRMFRIQHGRLPTGLQELCPDATDADAPSADGWGNAFAYAPLKDGTYDLVSYGADGAPGGSDEDEDISIADARRM